MRFLLALLLAAPLVRAQGSIETDRPDFTESTAVVPLNRVQAEAGATYQRGGGADAFSGPELLVRWSPRARLELRFTAPDYVESEGASGFADPSVGLKAALGAVGGLGLAAIVTAPLPVGDSVASGGFAPVLLLTASRDLTPDVSLGGQVGTTWDTEADALDLAATLVVGAGLTERLGTFLELAAEGLQAEHPALLLHHGYTYGLGPDAQVDLHVGVGLTAEAPEWLVGAGVALRR